ncbi:hypothetical protein M5K25_006651 [Dendrobium thyrsiflorum]|uniref:BED-type domain-containing protein n=1 Tax=Dendrobium thyrsiflorum TaxID=117978 RepID=A0ABD0VC62_DENTH
MVRGKKSNASLRRDPSWKYSVQVDIGGAEKTYVYLKCNFCDKVVKGGVTRMKEHLSGSHKNVAPCANVPDKVKEEICAYMKKSITAKHLQQEQFDDRVEQGSYYGSESGKGSSSTIHSRGARGPMDQYMVNPGEDRGQTQMSILDVRQPLEAMFTSTQWLNSAWGKKPEGKEVRRHILNDKFWATVTYAILSTRPLVQVLRLVDAEKKPAMGFIYNAMDEAKELIAHNLGGEEASYREIWDIIDARWEVQLHRHLHAAAYYLNPQFQYSERKSSNPEVKLGLYHCMERLIPDLTVREIADLQLVLFRNREGFFGLHAAKSTIVKRSPVE